MPIVEAAASFVATQREMAKRIEAAMADAAQKAHVRGERDPAVVRSEMLAARDRVKNARAQGGPPRDTPAKAR